MQNKIQTDKPGDFKSLQSFIEHHPGCPPNGVEPEEFTHEDEFISELPQGILWNLARKVFRSHSHLIRGYPFI